MRHMDAAPAIEIIPREIVLSTLNARYMHTAFGLRYLYANLGELQDRTEIIEFNFV